MAEPGEAMSLFLVDFRFAQKPASEADQRGEPALSEVEGREMGGSPG